MSVKELIERYVYAVGKNLPRKGREDIEKEITTLIYDMLEERCGEVPATEKDVRIVIEELGAPVELANEYSSDKDKCLIGPPYYSQYKMLLKMVMPALIAGITIAGCIEFVIESWQRQLTAMEYVQQLIGWSGTLLTGMACVFTFLTLLFVYLQRKGVFLSDVTDNDWRNLRPVPKKEETIKKSEAIANMVFSCVFLIVFLFLPHIICAVVSVDGENQVIPVLNSEALRQSWYFIVIFFILGIIKNVFEYIEGRYTKRMAFVTGVTNLLSFLCAIVWLTGTKIISPAFIENMNLIFSEKERFVKYLMTEFQLFFLGVLTFALVLDFGVTLYRALKYDKM